jgi:predicted Zn-dependent protease
MKKLRVVICFLILGLCFSCSKTDNLEENGINTAANNKNIGSSARDFLQDVKYKSLVIEVSYAVNLLPNMQSLQNMKMFLEQRLNKPDGITLVLHEIPTQTGSPFTNAEIRSIEDNFRTKYNNGSVLALHLMFLNGNSQNDTPSSFTLGVAYRNTSCVIFENSVQILSMQPSQPSRIDLETTVMEHEICHLLGLVDIGAPMINNHLDMQNDKHCNVSSCLMYFQVESNSITNMMNGNVPHLDANCLADLQGIGGK